MGTPLSCLNWSHEVLLQKYGILLRCTTIPCLAVAFQVPQNRFGIWYRKLCRKCLLHRYMSSREKLGLFQMPLFYLWKRKETSFLVFSLLSCKQELASNGVNPVRGLSWRSWLWTSAILSGGRATCSLEHNSALCCLRIHSHSSNTKARAEFYH